MTRVSAKANKSRGKADERDVARILGATRHKADSGGPEDLYHENLAIQVKGRVGVPAYLGEGVDSAKVAAVGTAKLPVFVLVDRSGTRLRRYAIIDLHDFADWEGCHAEEEAE